MRRLILSILVLSAVVLSGCSAVAGAPQRTLAVTGNGTARVTPDVVTVTLGIQTRHDDVEQAVAQNNAVAARIMEAARSSGVSDADMRTAYFSVYTQPRYDEFGSPTGEVSYFVDNSLEVRLRDVTKLSDLLQNAVNAGANSIYGVNFSVADTQAAQDEARVGAISDAQARADELAGLAGVTLGPIQSISTGAYSFPQPYYQGYGMGGGGGEAAAAPPTVPGTLEVAAQVTIVYEVR
ncbi:MAG TPA: SIMPL domain-containing protein [Anaerolineales bacterium]|nr:SIMPL domain-containing protein [Anaerolineales bacterium]